MTLQRHNDLEEPSVELLLTLQLPFLFILFEHQAEV